MKGGHKKRHTAGSLPPDRPGAGEGRNVSGQQAVGAPDNQLSPVRQERSLLAESIKTAFNNKFAGTIERAHREHRGRADVTFDLQGVKELVALQQWRDVCALSEDLFGAYISANANPSSPAVLQPHQYLELSVVYLVGCLKLKRFKTASDHLSRLGDLDGPQYDFHYHLGVYPEKEAGSFVPFSLRVLRAYVPRFMGQLDASSEQLYRLLDMVRQQPLPEKDDTPPKFDFPEANADVGGALLDPLLNSQFVASKQRPRPVITLSPFQARLHRERMVAFVLIDHHLALKQYPVAVGLMRQLIATDPENPLLYQQLARLCLQIGYTSFAAELCEKSEQLMNDEASTQVRLARGFLKVARGDYAAALAEFNLVLHDEPFNVHARNNKAICHLHLGSLAKAVECLETLIEAWPQAVTHESVVQNLCALYDLQNANVEGKKEVLLELIQAVGPDSFDLSIGKLQV